MANMKASALTIVFKQNVYGQSLWWGAAAVTTASCTCVFCYVYNAGAAEK